ncbi:YcnI family copper-binding membrane protein [Kribbella deserti]|uniref:YcnI family protein n=1 Tax=Kribbella deserti TaxID=1926257 RepID=A0ABV6QM14_9ACTN
MLNSAQRRFAAIATVGTGLLLFTAGTASAHVGVTPNTTAAGAYSVLTFAVPHGCDGSGTTKVSIKIPEQFASVTPTVNPNWQVQKVMVKLATPIKDSHGNEVTERVGEVVYTAKTPLPDGYRDTFQLQAKLPEKVGETLVFPTVQTCQKGETAWVEVPKDGKTEDDLEAPAPSIVVTAAEKDGHDVDVKPVAATTSSDSGTPAVTWVALAVGVLGLATGGAALARSRKS